MFAYLDSNERWLHTFSIFDGVRLLGRLIHSRSILIMLMILVSLDFGRWFCRIQMFLEKVNTKSCLTYDCREICLVLIRIQDIAFMAWYVSASLYLIFASVTRELMSFLPPFSTCNITTCKNVMCKHYIKSNLIKSNSFLKKPKRYLQLSYPY